jgi:hypothetical protein
MSDESRDQDAWINRVAAVLREQPDADAEAQIMARVRRQAAHLEHDRRRSPWDWLTRPRLVRLRPIVPLAGTALLALALAVAIRTATIRPSFPAGSAQTVTARSGNSRPVQFVCLAAGARQVSVVGDFTDWQPGAAPMERAGDEGIWAGVLWLPPGVYEYAFVVDGRLCPAHDVRPAALPDEFGVPNSVLIVDREAI